jgi:two-component system response regulator QseB
MHLLLIEDDLDLGAALQAALATQGFTSEWVRNARDARAHTRDGEARYACALLDLGLPDGQGVDLLRAWRNRNLAMPVIVLTANDAVSSRVGSLDAGADDYVIKPVAPEELTARVRAVTRRAAGQSSSRWRVGPLEVDVLRCEVRVDGCAIALSPKEFQIVEQLARHAGEVVPKHRVARALSPLGDPPEFVTLEWHVHNLRRKLGAQSIRTVRGVGYVMGE